MLTITRNKETQEATIMQKKNPRISQSCTLTSNILSLFLNPTCTPQNESKAGKAKCKTEQSFLITRTRIITDFKGDKLIHMRKNMPTDVSCDQFFFLITPLFPPQNKESAPFLTVLVLLPVFLTSLFWLPFKLLILSPFYFKTGFVPF